MAIKGKSKPRGRKSVTPGPRPAYVPVKRRWWQKGGFWIGVLVVLVAGSAAGIWYGVAKEIGNNRREADRKALATRMRDAVGQYQGLVEPIISPLGQTVAPAGFDILPQLSTTISDLEKGAVSAKDAGSAANTISEQAKTAYQALDKVDVVKLVQDKGFNQSFVVFLLDSKSKMVTGIKLFEHAAQQLVLATGLAGTAREQLIADAKGLAQIATDTFTDGYTDYVQVQAAAGVLNVNPAGQVPGVP
jgi:hypothetical protein